MEINSKMELFDDSPVKKRRRKKNGKRIENVRMYYSHGPNSRQ